MAKLPLLKLGDVKIIGKSKDQGLVEKTVQRSLSFGIRKTWL